MSRRTTSSDRFTEGDTHRNRLRERKIADPEVGDPCWRHILKNMRVLPGLATVDEIFFGHVRSEGLYGCSSVMYGDHYVYWDSGSLLWGRFPVRRFGSLPLEVTRSENAMISITSPLRPSFTACSRFAPSRWRAARWSRCWR